MAITNQPTECRYDERKQWFLDRIGKRVWRNKNSCPCFKCNDVYENGLIIDDKDSAIYLTDVEAISNAEGVPNRYFDTQLEVAQFETTITNNFKK